MRVWNLVGESVIKGMIGNEGKLAAKHHTAALQKLCP